MAADRLDSQLRVERSVDVVLLFVRMDHNTVDILVITAVKEEFDAVLQVDDGAAEGSRWVVDKTSANLEIAFRSFVCADGTTLSIAATRTVEMGGVAAADAASPLVSLYKPRALAMCGICAGRRGHVNLGDVIIADRLWFYDTGKQKVDEDGEKRVWGDMHQYKIRAAWIHPAERYLPGSLQDWIATRPRTYEQQEDWLLDRLAAGEDPKTQPDRQAACFDYNLIIGRLQKRRFVKRGPLQITSAGRLEVQRRADLIVEQDPAFRVRLGPIGSGACVVEDETIFDRLTISMRKVLGLEMEAAAIAAVAYHQEIPSIVMKGVQDFADPKKNDNFRGFAARASAECLIGFLRAHPPPPGTAPKSDGDDRGAKPIGVAVKAMAPPSREVVYLRRRCRVIHGGSATFRRMMTRLLMEKHDADVLQAMRVRAGKLGSSFERTIALAAIQECDGRIEEMTETLRAVNFLGEEECCRRLLLGISLEKLDKLSAAISENDWILRNAKTSGVLLAAQFNSHVCHEKGNDFDAVNFGGFVARQNDEFLPGERLWHKALSMDLIASARSGRRCEHEHLVDQALKDESVTSPTGYAKTLLNWAAYRGMRLEKSVLNQMTNQMRHFTTNARTAMLSRVAQGLREAGDEEGAQRLHKLVEDCAHSSRSDTVKRLLLS